MEFIPDLAILMQGARSSLEIGNFERARELLDITLRVLLERDGSEAKSLVEPLFLAALVSARSQNQIDDGIRCQERAIAISKNANLFRGAGHSYALNQYGNLLMAARRYEEALLALKSAVELSGDCEEVRSHALGGIVLVYLLTERPEAALPFAERLTALERTLTTDEDPKRPSQALLRLADCYRGIGKIADAIDTYQQAAALDPKTEHYVAEQMLKLR